MRVAITPHGTTPSAIKGTIATFEGLSGANFKADPELDDQGRITGTTTNAHFMAWASDRQGYAKKVEKIS